MPSSDFFKFLKDLEAMCDALTEHRHDLIVHKHINLFYYMQKIEVLKFLSEQLNKKDRKLSEVFDSEVRSVHAQWSKDSQWLNKHLAKNKE